MSRNRRLVARLLLISLALPCASRAHEGHEDEPAEKPVALQPGSAMQKPHLLADGQLFVPKAVQHALGLRTEVFGAVATSTSQIITAGEVIAGPNSFGSISALQTGRLEATQPGWPLPGRKVEAGELLAYLRPLLSTSEQAQRRAALAQIDNDMQIAEINVERLKLQAKAIGTAEKSGNVYYEQARLDWEALKEKYRLESEALNSRIAIQAPVAGVLISAMARPGEVVTIGQPLFEVVDPAHLRIAVRSFDPALMNRVESARVDNDEGAAITLSLRGREPLAAQQGWRLLLEAPSASRTGLAPGQILPVTLQLSARKDADLLAETCVAGAAGRATAWVHVAPERFERRSLPGCQFGAEGKSAALTIAAGERVVTQGAALLTEYR